MHDFYYLKDILIILSVAVVVVIGFHRLKLPAIAGFILSGIIVGPQGFGLVSDPHQVKVIAEIGIALLLFGIGLELPLSKLKRLWNFATIGGFLQVGVTASVAYALGKYYGLPNNTALMIGFIVALSSTAIVLRGLQQRGEVDAPHGRLILGILVFQDFIVIPIMLIVPLLIGVSSNSSIIIYALLKAAGIIIFVLTLSILLVPRILRIVAKTGQRQLFILSVFVICLGTAWLVTKSGASLAIGAFLAGLVVAGSEYRHQAMSDMISFREIFSSLFFVTVGMMLLPGVIITNIVPIITLLFAIIVGKSIIVFVTSMIMKMPIRVSLISALALAQIGEFSLVLFYSVQGTGLIAESVENNLVSAAILSMFITPFFMSFAPKLAAGIGRFKRFKSMSEIKSVEDVAETTCKMCDHVIVAGYGFAGRELSNTLKENNITFFVTDLNIENVKTASEEVGNAVFGDITSPSVLSQLGIENARELVILINDPIASAQAIRVARQLSPNLYITVRTPYLLDIKRLIDSGANDVITSEREAAVQVVSQVLNRYDYDDARISELTSKVRKHSEDESAY